VNSFKIHEFSSAVNLCKSFPDGAMLEMSSTQFDDYFCDDDDYFYEMAVSDSEIDLSVLEFGNIFRALYNYAIF